MPIFCVKELIPVILLLSKTPSAALLQLQAMMTLLKPLLLGHPGKH